MAEVKQFDLDAFKAFVASKPADRKYPGWSPGRCALAQFGFPHVASHSCERSGIPLDVYECVVPNGGAAFTFGALATRLATLDGGSGR